MAFPLCGEAKREDMVNPGEQLAKLRHDDGAAHMQRAKCGTGQLTDTAGVAVVGLVVVGVGAECPATTGTDDNAAELMRPPLRFTLWPPILACLDLDDTLPQWQM